MVLAIFVINAVVSLGSVLGAIIALARPQSISNSPTVTDGERFYSWMYVVRALPMGFLLGSLPFFTRGRVGAVVLFVGAFIQLLDAVIGAIRKKKGMMFGPAVAAIVHVICGSVMW